jgi:hypothetical protein
MHSDKGMLQGDKTFMNLPRQAREFFPGRLIQSQSGERAMGI